jgi:hypothetical protein
LGADGKPAEVEQLLTGNRARDGAVIFYAGKGLWSPAIAEALLVANGAGEALLAEAQGAPGAHLIIAPYLIEAVRDGGTIRPVELRERIRAQGPTA